MRCHIILYVEDQTRSATFYSSVLDLAPTLDVPGMTEFKLSDDCSLGLMPESGIMKLLAPNLPDPATANGVARSEVYLIVDDCRKMYERALKQGASPLSESAERDWGHRVAYCLDPDGHVLAFAEIINRV